ncbi:hypothetical protein ACIBHX_46950 [Nonomuraea sp. NPDC050536]|uniref:hypothetical protein n=1 Tax=Nonomuraea sp. NPDC050536 TaxID=3364366 RepID=UPI0037C90FDE
MLMPATKRLMDAHDELFILASACLQEAAGVTTIRLPVTGDYFGALHQLETAIANRIVFAVRDAVRQYQSLFDLTGDMAPGATDREIALVNGVAALREQLAEVDEARAQVDAERTSP